jgi:hypothetical protein
MAIYSKARTNHRAVFAVGSPYPPTSAVTAWLLKLAIIGRAAAMAFLTFDRLQQKREHLWSLAGCGRHLSDHSLHRRVLLWRSPSRFDQSGHKAT